MVLISFPVFNVDIVLNSGLGVVAQQFHAMLVKRMLHTWRNWLVTATQLFIPLFFTILGLIVLKTNPSLGDSPALTLQLSDYGDNVLTYGSGHPPNNFTTSLGQSYAEQFVNLPQAQTVDINKDSPPNVTGMMEYLEMEGVRSLGTYVNNYIIGAEFTADQNETNATAFFNNQGFHTCAVALGAIQVRISFCFKWFFSFRNPEHTQGESWSSKVTILCILFISPYSQFLFKMHSHS